MKKMVLGNKKGLSDVVTTLLIILVAVAAVAIIGTVVLRNVQKAGTQIDVQQQCAQVEIKPISCDDNGATDSVVVQRGASGSDVKVYGVKILGENPTTGVVKVANSGGAYTSPDSPPPNALATTSYSVGALVAANDLVSSAVVLRGADGKEVNCEPSTIKVTCT